MAVCDADSLRGAGPPAENSAAQCTQTHTQAGLSVNQPGAKSRTSAVYSTASPADWDRGVLLREVPEFFCCISRSLYVQK